MTESPLATALARFQADLPHIGKDNLAVVKSDKGSYKYTYADLAQISAKVLPLLAQHGLSFSAKPTLFDGKFVLEYTLRHTSGEADTGYYPLNGNGTPQQVGSAITYARRYALSAVTGIVPDEDDDGQAASRPEVRQDMPVQRNPPVDAAEQAREDLRQMAAENKWDLRVIAARFQNETGGALRDATSAQVIREFSSNLFSLSDEVLGRNGAPA